MRELEQALGQPGRLEQVEHVARRSPLQLGRLLVGGERFRLGQQLGESVVEALAHARLELELAPGRAQRVVDADEHRAQAAGPVGREQLPAVGLVGGAELLQGGVEGLALQHPRLRLVEHAEPRIDARGQRVGGEEPAAEAVNRRDPGAVEVTGEIGTVELEQARADPGAQLAGGAVGVGDHEQRVDVEAVVDDRAGESLDEDGRLAGAGARGDERRAACLDRGLLLRVRAALTLIAQRPATWPGVAAHGRSLRHIRQRSHQPGQSPPRGSCAHVAGPDAPRQHDGGIAGVLDLRLELRPVEVVGRREPRHLVVAGAEHAAGAAAAAERHVDAAHRLEPELIAQHEQVERESAAAPRRGSAPPTEPRPTCSRR